MPFEKGKTRKISFKCPSCGNLIEARVAEKVPYVVQCLRCNRVIKEKPKGE